jgi:hypothetical protein
MKTSVCEYRMFRVVTMLVFVLSVVSVAGASEAGVIVRGEDESPAAGYEVFGATVSSDDSALPGVLITLSGDGVNQKTVSDTDGAFHFVSVPPGSYSMVFKMKGKKKVKREVTVSTGNLDMGKITID